MSEKLSDEELDVLSRRGWVPEALIAEVRESRSERDSLRAELTEVRGELADAIVLNMGLEQNQDDLSHEHESLRAEVLRLREIIFELCEAPGVRFALGKALIDEYRARSSLAATWERADSPRLSLRSLEE